MAERKGLEMIYKPYGRTGIEVSALAFGGMRFIDQDDVDSCAQLVKSAYDAGINYFDTAPGYGKSEDLFGVAFKEMKRTRSERPFYVSTKTSRSKPDDIRRDLDLSLQRMNIDAIDFYHMWCIIKRDAYERRKAAGALEEFGRLQEEGLIRHVCISTHMTGPEIGDLLADYPFAGVLLGYSAMNFAYREAGIEAAARQGCGVMVMNPLGGGLIPTHPERFAFVRTRPEESTVAGALRFIWSDPRITAALVGFSSPAQLAEALQAMDNHTPLTEAELQQIRSHMSDAFNELCTGCRYCDVCPVDIPVVKYMEAYNHLMLSGSEKEMLTRLRFHWGINRENSDLDRCIECGACEEACTQKLPILARFADIQRIMK